VTKKIIVVIPHSHTFFWTQTCIASLMRNPPKAEGYEVSVCVVDNSPWSPAIKGVPKLCPNSVMSLWVTTNDKTNKFHASALDSVVERYQFDYLMAWETDVLALRPTWLQWFMDQMKPTDFAVGAWHHEQFINPSCTLYRGDVLREMNRWCKGNAHNILGKVPENELRWGENFSQTAPLDNNLPLSENPAEVLRGIKNWIAAAVSQSCCDR